MTGAVLIVDARLTVRMGLADAFESAGFRPLTCATTPEARAALEREPVALVVLDVVLPKGDGVELVRQIRAGKTTETPVLVLSTESEGDGTSPPPPVGTHEDFGAGHDFAPVVEQARALVGSRSSRPAGTATAPVKSESAAFPPEVRGEQVPRDEVGRMQEHAALVAEIERRNSELETFMYAVSHDLRAPLRRIEGFSEALFEDYGKVLDAQGRDYLGRVRGGVKHMAGLIDDLLALSRLGRADLHRRRVDLCAIAGSVLEELREREPGRKVAFAVMGRQRLTADADERLMRIVFENLLGNAWKFTAKVDQPRIDFGAEPRAGDTVYFVRDNGAGFDMALAKKLFTPFQRLHTGAEFPGRGIGLATVYRVIDRHGGRVWAEGAVGGGATVFFTVPPPRIP